ncbi:MAG TPA: dTDP-4-dehydrorhamnose reductase [Pyrinomonadaceae bacterium]|nr:dTDP-4-dehydrorhamnose reductase [Pyrinomonadaceae bacterium]
MKVLITGANGMVAGAARAHCESIGDAVVALTRQEMDIADRDAVFRVIEGERPNAILNCAAYTDVDGAETNVDASRHANTDGVQFLAEASREFDARFITISTDYVFDGDYAGFYTEDAAPNPRGIYAETKYNGELAAANANDRSVIVRSGWIYGSGGTNFLSVMHRLLADGKRIKAIKDSYGTPTYAHDLAKRLRQLAATDATGVVHVTNAGDGTSYLGFAEKVCEVGGFDPNLIEAVSHEDLKRPAPRPVSSKLASVRLDSLSLPPLQYWADALSAFMASESATSSAKKEG